MRTARDTTIPAISTTKVLYWAATGVAASGLGAIGILDVVQAPPIIEGLAHLGYPPYFATILGTWKLLGTAAILAPGFPRVKEWAYAGMFFTLTGAAISHAVSGDPLGEIIVPLVLLASVLASWRLRPARSAEVHAGVQPWQVA
ncbi:MAG TPA: DoxX family protein [Vicinamibacterales bacterium]|nr:DoxX family protein [Vicinamibacterales bacterium]